MPGKEASPSQVCDCQRWHECFLICSVCLRVSVDSLGIDTQVTTPGPTGQCCYLVGIHGGKLGGPVYGQKGGH